jgi:hypothetical protein
MGFWRDFFGLDGGLADPRPLARTPAALPVDALVGIAGLQSVTEALLKGVRLGLSASAIAPLLPCGWWDDEAGPPRTNKDADIVECWGRLNRMGLGCEGAAWAKVLDDGPMNRLALGFVLDYQLKNLVVLDPSELPLRWGAVYGQFAVAAYNALWAASVAAQGAGTGRVGSVLGAWPEEAGQSIAASGDLVLAHAIRCGFDAQAMTFEGGAQLALDDWKEARRRHEETQKEVRWWTVWGARSEVNGRVTAARQAESDAAVRLGWAQQALKLFRSCAERLRAIDALGAMREGNASPLPFVYAAIEPAAASFRSWFIREMVPQLISGGVPKAGHAGMGKLMEDLAGLLVLREAYRWDAGIFVLRFFRMYIMSCGSAEQIRAVWRSEPERSYFQGFFGSWNALRRMAAGAVDDGSDAARAFFAEWRSFRREKLDQRLIEIADAARSTLGRIPDLEAHVAG